MTSGDSAVKTERLLGRRLITALILMPLALLCIWVGGRLYAALIAAMTIFLVFEWTRMVDGAELRRAFYVLSATAAGATFFAASGEPAAALLLTALGGFLGTLFAWPRPSPTSWPAVGALYIIVPAVAALWIRRDHPDGAFLTLLLFICVWAADSAAFAAGKVIGGPKLLPAISPNKTWAGALGAVLAAALCGALLATIMDATWLLGGFFLGAALGAAAVLGDLVESTIKRRYGVKDTGGAFPGHGGVLDRLDGFLFAVLALAAIVLLLQVGSFNPR